MNKPKMILFDYGHTLLAEPNYDSLCGTKAVMSHAIKNPQNLCDCIQRVYDSQAQSPAV